MHRAFFIILACLAAAALAQPILPGVPGTEGDDSAFRSEAATRYRTILARLAASGKLDEDGVALDRARRIAAGLIAAAKAIRPATGTWSWEVHVTSDASVAATCMAGGKILLGSDFVRRLDLSDGELAMLLGHEMAHAVAGHRRAVVRPQMDTDAAQEVREARIAVMQEKEADEIGMALAYRAGWPLASLVGFFDKLAAQETPGTFNSSHPSAALRAADARTLARTLGR
jgi:predicted Zn-dependent protease